MTQPVITQPIDVGNASARELQGLFGLAKCTFGDTPGWDDLHVLDVLQRDIVFVAHRRAQPAGYVALRPETASGAVVVEQLLVAPGHEREGVGHRLLAHAEGYAIASGAQALQIVAEEDNWRARSFYSRSGFVPVEAELLELVLPQRA
jgi:ribosomal protein S18 acetylase RimI-like enzyme